MECLYFSHRKIKQKFSHHNRKIVEMVLLKLLTLFILFNKSKTKLVFLFNYLHPFRTTRKNSTIYFRLITIRNTTRF